MKNRIKLIAGVAVGITLLAALSSCSALDVVGKDSIRAFENILAVSPAQGNTQNGWHITAPDGSSYFSWDNQSFSMAVDAQPFVAAGLDRNKLGNANENDIVYLSPAFNMLNTDEQSTPLKHFEKDVKALRDSLNYHTSLDHYGVKFGEGNMFEWAKDMLKNGTTGENQDKDMVFVLNPEPLIAAGVDPEKVEGWLYTQVQVEENGKMATVYRFLKPFNLS